MYRIKNGYKCNSEIGQYEETVYNSMHYQVNVYQFAATVLRDRKLESVLDIGCGFGMKLINYIYPVCHRIVGIDLKESVSFCKSNLQFADVDWIQDNVENPCVIFNENFDLIIASDVVEHLMNPNMLFEYIRKHSHSKTIVVLSTPERDVVRGETDMGPPPNLSHIREWNQEELKKYIEENDFKVLESFLAKDIYFIASTNSQILLIQDCKNV